MTLTHQRLFGRTKLDAFDFPYQGWYMITSGTETKITATAAQLNGLGTLPLTAGTFAPATGYFTYLSGTGAGEKQLWTDVATTLVGTEATTGLSHTSGVLKATLGYNTTSIDVTNDDMVFKDHSDSHIPKVASVSSIVTAITGDGLIASAGTIDTAYYGAMAIGSVRFTGVGDCDAVQVGSRLYTRAAVPVVTNGEWTEGASAAASATNLAAGINGDTRNAGSSYYTATVNTDTVHIYSKVVGGDVAIALTGAAPTEPSVRENLVGGALKAAAQSVIVARTVTANDVQTAVLVNIPLPFVPAYFMVQIRNSAGVIRNDVTDAFSVGATPNRIILTDAGATHVIAGDVITVFAQE